MRKTFGFSVVNDGEITKLLSFGGHLWYTCSSEYDGVGVVVVVRENGPLLYAYRLASCSGEMAGMLYLLKISIALRCSSSYKSPRGPIGFVRFVNGPDCDIGVGGVEGGDGDG